jgi:hypothetical protein
LVALSVYRKDRLPKELFSPVEPDKRTIDLGRNVRWIILKPVERDEKVDAPSRWDDLDSPTLYTAIIAPRRGIGRVPIDQHGYSPRTYTLADLRPYCRTQS